MSTPPDPDASPPAGPGEFAAPSPAELDAALPDYSVTALIAQGGMGAVYQGEQTRLERPVAIKVLPRDFGAELNDRARFEGEAKAMAKLSHTHIVSVYDYGETADDRWLYFVMEFVAGETLFDKLHRQGALPQAEAIAIFKQMGEALRYAHDNGIVHRDIKPANILLDGAGTVKIADFGLAKLQHHDDEEEAFGTPDYVAPESVMEGVVVDQRADLYSLGVVMYECLTGEVPRLKALLPSSVNPDIDPRFDALVSKAMAHERDERFAGAAGLLAALAEIESKPRLKSTDGKPPVARPVAAVAPATRRGPTPLPSRSLPQRRPGAKPTKVRPRAKSNAGPIAVSMLIAASIIGGGLYWMLADPASRETPHPAPAPPESFDPRSPDQVSGSAPASSPSPPPSLEPATDSTTDPRPTALSQTGMLRAFGTERDLRPVTTEAAASFTDIVRVQARARSWLALRANGKVISSDPKNKAPEEVVFFNGRALYTKYVTRDGSVFAANGRPVFPDEINDAVQAAGGYGHNVVLRENGAVLVWGKRYGDKGTPSDPPLPLEGIVDIAATQDCVAAVDRAGRIVCWNVQNELFTEFTEEPVVAVEAGIYRFIALTRSGRVFQWRYLKIDDREAIEEIDRAVAIRAGGETGAAQREDGTWFAWGKNPGGIVDQINALPPSPDIAFHSDPRVVERGYVVWIEPSDSP